MATVQTSRLLVQFARAHPKGVVQDEQGRAWLLNSEAEAGKHGGALEEYLALISHAGQPEAILDARLDFAEPGPRLVSLLGKAAREGRGVRVFYKSMRSPSGRERVLYPRAVVRLSQRWHLRAWCAERCEYRDFNLGRMTRAALLTEVLPKGVGPDAAWEKQLTIRIGVHEALKGDVASMLRAEYFGGAASMRLEIRAALAQYVLQEARVAIQPSVERPPGFLLQVLDRRELKPFLFEDPIGG